MEGWGSRNRLASKELQKRIMIRIVEYPRFLSCMNIFFIISKCNYSIHPRFRKDSYIVILNYDYNKL